MHSPPLLFSGRAASPRRHRSGEPLSRATPSWRAPGGPYAVPHLPWTSPPPWMSATAAPSSPPQAAVAGPPRPLPGCPDRTSTFPSPRRRLCARPLHLDATPPPAPPRPCAPPPPRAVLQPRPLLSGAAATSGGTTALRGLHSAHSPAASRLHPPAPPSLPAAAPPCSAPPSLLNRISELGMESICSLAPHVNSSSSLPLSLTSGPGLIAPHGLECMDLVHALCSGPNSFSLSFVSNSNFENSVLPRRSSKNYDSNF